MLDWIDSTPEDEPALKQFTCYREPTWAPNTSWGIKKKHQIWVRAAQKIARTLCPPAAQDEWQLVVKENVPYICGVFVVGVERTELDEASFFVYLIAKSVDMRGRSVGSSALARLDDVIMEYVRQNPDVVHIIMNAKIHTSNLPSQTLFESFGWWSGDPCNDASYLLWHNGFSLEE